MFYNAALKRTTLKPYDMPLFWATLTLLALGVIMVYSASIAVAEKMPSHNAQYYLGRHMISMVVAGLFAVALFRLPSASWQKWALPLFLVSTLLLLLVLVPGIGKEVKGSWRWINLGPLGNFQVSELMKLATLIYAADYTVRKAALMGSIQKGFLPMLLVMVGISALLQLQPDMGAAVVIIAIAMGVLFLGGLNLRLFLLLLLLVIAGLILFVNLYAYRLERLGTYINPWMDPLGAGYQITNALMAVGRGGWFGMGLGESVGKLSYLPEAHTDFLAAIIAEELGALGILVILGLFAWVIWRAFSIGWQASLMGRNFQALVAQGVAIWMGVQCFINIGVNLGALPAKGLTLPLMSYGGSSLLVNCMAMALLLRVDYENRLLMRGGRLV